MRRLLVVPLSVTLWVTACSPTPPSGDAGVDAGVVDGGDPGSGWCARESRETTADGFSVVVCEEAFTTPPLVRAPADTVSTVYGGLERDPQGTIVFGGRTQNYRVESFPWVMRESASTNVRYPYFIYRGQRRNDSIEDAQPVLRVDDRVMQRLIAGKVFEGLASARISDGGTDVRYAFDALDVPIRVRLDAMVQATETDRLYGVPRYAVLGRIENATSGARASDGGCFPALSSLGERSPIFGGTGDQVMVLRHPNMHGGMDDVFTFDWPMGASQGNNMGGGLFVSTASLLRSTAPALNQADSHPHGTPWGGPSVELQAVEGGGAVCTP